MCFLAVGTNFLNFSLGGGVGRRWKIEQVRCGAAIPRAGVRCSFGNGVGVWCLGGGRGWYRIALPGLNLLGAVKRHTGVGISRDQVIRLHMRQIRILTD